MDRTRVATRWRATSGRRARRSCRDGRRAPRPAPRARSRPARSVALGGATYCRLQTPSLRRRQRRAVQLAVRRQRQRAPAPRTRRVPCTRAARCRRCARSSSRRQPPSLVRHDVGHQACRRGASSRATTTASRTRRCRSSAASISPSSIRKPRIFTWWSARPRYSRSRPAASEPDRRSGTAARPPARERIGHKALGRQLRPVQIAARHPGAADVELARDAAGTGSPCRSSTYTAACWRSGGRCGAIGRAPSTRCGGRPDRGLGRPVHVPQLGSRARRAAPRQRGRSASPPHNGQPSGGSAPPSTGVRQQPPGGGVGLHDVAP